MVGHSSGRIFRKRRELAKTVRKKMIEEASYDPIQASKWNRRKRQVYENYHTRKAAMTEDERKAPSGGEETEKKRKRLDKAETHQQRLTATDYTQVYLDFLGPEWVTRWSSATPDDSRSVAGIALQLMATIGNSEIIDLLSRSDLYRYRTSTLFNITWTTQDDQTYRASETNSWLLTRENGWGRDRLERFNDHDGDNIYIAEGQYISGCIVATCFRVSDLLDVLAMEPERYRRREIRRQLRRARRARIIAQEMASLHSFLHVSLQQMAYGKSVNREKSTTVIPVARTRINSQKVFGEG
ncbi:hypothetical protein FGADI_12333 [Fusarium gaditjirri]|uniref:Uncharacterized protein n=1 Tax=Fusarium gaditjirri TaxID=282569 RepID=A0A8H4SSQ7_9HYPO|nr:hypothetical protein FGADI_12333 [Fusarium gaditjirri]